MTRFDRFMEGPYWYGLMIGAGAMVGLALARLIDKYLLTL